MRKVVDPFPIRLSVKNCGKQIYIVACLLKDILHDFTLANIGNEMFP